MDKKMKNEELQSRREFFKKAAKGALPILAAVALAGAPSIVKAAETPIMGCINSCSGSCSVVCADSCAGNCKGSCKYGCSTTCSGTCSGSSK